MATLRKRAEWIWWGQKYKIGVEYTLEEFTKWYLKEYKKKKWKRPHVARFDHSKAYSFSNVEMQEQAENNRERNARRGNPGCTHRAVVATTKEGTRLSFASKRDAAKFFGVSEKTIYNHCMGRTKIFGMYGPITEARRVRFEWSS